MKSLRPFHLAMLGALSLLVAYTILASAADSQTIVLASTTSVENSGLLARILPQFTKETGIEVHVVAQGTGQALATAAHGDADLVLVHDPEAEAKFMAAGDGLTRQEIAWNDFIIVGPSSDPAHVAGTRDAVAALKMIAAANVPFCLTRRQERHRCAGKTAVESRRPGPGCGRGRMVSRHRRRHGSSIEHRGGNERLYTVRSRHLAELRRQGGYGDCA